MTSSLPADLEVRGIEWLWAEDAVSIICSSESFEPIEEGSTYIPDFNPTFRVSLMDASEVAVFLAGEAERFWEQHPGAEPAR